MSHVSQLVYHEHLLRSLVAVWHDLTVTGEDPSALRERISTELAETQMRVERYLAELTPGERAVEAYRLEFALPTFSYLKRWYHLFVPGVDATRPAGAT